MATAKKALSRGSAAKSSADPVLKAAVRKPRAATKSAGKTTATKSVSMSSGRPKAAVVKAVTAKSSASAASADSSSTVRRAAKPAAVKSASKTSGVRTAADKNALQSGQVDAALVVDITSSTGVESEASGLVRRPVRRAPAVVEAQSAPVVRGVSKDGVAYTKDFDIKFLTTQKALLLRS